MLRDGAVAPCLLQDAWGMKVGWDLYPDMAEFFGVMNNTRIHALPSTETNVKDNNHERFVCMCRVRLRQEGKFPSKNSY